MDLKAEMHALLSSIEDEAARLDLRISLAAIEQGATRLRGRIGVLEERAAGAGADAAHGIFNDAGNFDSHEDGGFSDAMEEDWYGQDNVDEPAKAPAEQRRRCPHERRAARVQTRAPVGQGNVRVHGTSCEQERAAPCARSVAALVVAALLMAAAVAVVAGLAAMAAVM